MVHIGESNQSIVEFRVEHPSETVYLLYSQQNHYDLIVNKAQAERETSTSDSSSSSAEEDETTESESETSSSASSFSDM